MLRRLALSLLVVVPVAARGQPDTQADDATRQPLESLLARADEAYARRDEPGALDEARTALTEAAAIAPGGYDVLWRRARLLFWEADDPALGKVEQSRLGKAAWALGEEAIARDPSRVEGWDYAAAGMGVYALGLGIFRALGEGIEGKFKDRLSHAERIDPAYQGGAIQTAWGRFWYELPWPKYDAGRSERALQGALARNPDNVRAHVYLAQLYRKERRAGDAAEELGRALAHPPGRYDAPEERRWQGVARRLIDGK
jgi:tetratricopeptide (TPR) repeat protein